MSRIVGAGFVCLLVVVGVVVATRLPSESTAVVIGIVCGVGASIPTSAIILLLAQRRSEPEEPVERYRVREGYPPLIIVSGDAESPRAQRRSVGPASYGQPPSWGYGAEIYGERMLEAGQPYASAREFKVIGGGRADQNGESG